MKPNYDDSEGYQVLYDIYDWFPWSNVASSIKLTEYGKSKGIVLFSEMDQNRSINTSNKK